MDTIKTPRPTKNSNLFSTLLSPLDSRQCQVSTNRRERVDHAPERVTGRVSCEGDVMNVLEGGDGNFVQDTE